MPRAGASVSALRGRLRPGGVQLRGRNQGTEHSPVCAALRLQSALVGHGSGPPTDGPKHRVVVPRLPEAAAAGVIGRMALAIRAQREPVVITAISVVGLYLVGVGLVDDFSVPLSVLILGVIVGLTYGLLAVGLVLVHRTSDVVNFAHGEVGTVAASFFAVWVAGSALGGYGLPYWLMLPAAMAVGAGANMVVEAVAVRRLRKAPKVISAVMTLGAGQFFLLIALAINTRFRGGSVYPRPPGLPSFDVGALTVTSESTAMLLLTPLLVAALAWFLNRTRHGIALRASADSRDTALMSAIPAGRMSSLAWAIAGMTSAFVAVLQFPQKGFIIGGAALGPALLVRALLAAVVARFVSLPVALAFGVAIGIIEQVVLWNTTAGGVTELVLFVILLGVLLLQARDSRRARTSENWADIKPWPALPKAWRELPRVRRATPSAIALSALVFTGVGLGSNRLALAFTLVAAFAMVGLSVYVITGLAGQLALGQFAVAGVGAVVSVHFVENVLRSIPVGVIVGGGVGAALCAVIGIPALRIQGLMLAVTTLSFAVMAEAWLFAQSWAVGSGLQPPRLVIGDEPVGSARLYFLFSLPFLAGAFWLVRNISHGGYGRTLRGLRDNEDGARAFGVPARRRKIEAFALAGFLAGLGGAVFAHALPRVSTETLGASQSITVVALALIGGLSIIVGPLLGALYLIALPALVDLEAVGLAVSTFGWLILLLYFPGGLAQAAKPLRDRLLRVLIRSAPPETDARDVGDADAAEEIQAAASIPAAPRPDVGAPDVAARADDGPLLVLDGLRKSFGGVQAVSGVSLTVARGQTVGIIGPNGAGKTTLFELIGGFTAPDAGSVRFDGVDVTRLAPERRAHLGLVRSFQDAKLFPTLTVRETIQLAAERVAPTQLWSSLSAWPTAVLADVKKGDVADELIETMGLTAYANRTIRELSTGTRRIVDLAAVAALRPRLLMLDEPSSGVAQRETEAIGGLLTRLKELLDATFVIIEHDMPLLLGISDRVVAMETGTIIAEGAPEQIVNHPDVIASYLGSDPQAVGRSGSVATIVAPVDNGLHDEPSGGELGDAREAPEVTTWT